jgi:type I restriction enzyme R subunit
MDTKEELQWLIEKSNDKKTFVKQLSKDIAGRPYQLEAIQRVAETLVTDAEKGICGNKRRALLVMATGSGKPELQQHWSMYYSKTIG